MTSPSPSAHTLFLKSHKLTTLVYALPTTTLSALKNELFMLLHENATNLSITLPEESGDIVLGATIDGQRWHVISGQERARTTVADAGLTDGEAVAWKLDGEKNFIVNVPVEEEDGEGMEE